MATPRRRPRSQARSSQEAKRPLVVKASVPDLAVGLVLEARLLVAGGSASHGFTKNDRPEVLWQVFSQKSHVQAWKEQAQEKEHSTLSLTKTFA